MTNPIHSPAELAAARALISERDIHANALRERRGWFLFWLIVTLFFFGLGLFSYWVGDIDWMIGVILGLAALPVWIGFTMGYAVGCRNGECDQRCIYEASAVTGDALADILFRAQLGDNERRRVLDTFTRNEVAVVKKGVR